MRCTRFGMLQGDPDHMPRQLVLLEADSPADLQNWPTLPSPHFVCLVVWDAPPRPGLLLGLAQKVLDAGAVYVCAFGDGCERVHDAVDEIIVSDNREPDDEHAIMTTWHANESLDDALWYAMFTANPPAAYESTCRATVVLAIQCVRACLSGLNNSETRVFGPQWKQSTRPRRDNPALQRPVGFAARR